MPPIRCVTNFACRSKLVRLDSWRPIAGYHFEVGWSQMKVINWNTLPSMPRALRNAAIVSSLLVLPFLILQLVNRSAFHQSFPLPLFVLMWVLPLSFILILMPFARRLLGKGVTAFSLSQWARAAFLILIALLWIGLVLDQIPCFLGMPNCD